MSRTILAILSITTLILAPALGTYANAEDLELNLMIYPAPAGAELSDDYTITVNGKPVDAYKAPVWQPEYTPSNGGPYSFAYFDFKGNVKVSITAKQSLDKVRILPESAGIKPKISNGKLTFRLTKPCNISIEPDAKNGPLLLFANPIEKETVDRDDPNVKYFGPGIHEAGEIKLSDNDTLYIAGGAVVRGGINASGKNIKIKGRGIIDGIKWERFKGPTHNILYALDCNNLTIDGIIMKDSWTWTCVFFGCSNVKVDNIKICSTRCENNDGIDIVNTKNVRIKNSFVRSDDDCIAPKGMGYGNNMAVEDVTVTKCVLWTDRAHVWRVGCESRAEAMKNMLFKDIDVLHYSNWNTEWSPWMISLQPAEDMPMENIRFENIRVNGEGERNFIELMNAPTVWASKQTPGTVKNCVFKDIVVSGDIKSPLGMVSIRGTDGDHKISDITFVNIIRYGEKLQQDSTELEINQFAENMSFE